LPGSVGHQRRRRGRASSGVVQREGLPVGVVPAAARELRRRAPLLWSASAKQWALRLFWPVVNNGPDAYFLHVHHAAW